MFKRASIFAVILLAFGPAAFAQTAVDASGRVVRVDPGTQVIILDNNQAFRITPNTVLFVDNRPVPLATVQPGQTVVIRSGESVTMVPATPVPPATTMQTPTPTPGTTTVITSPSALAAPALAQQTVYGHVIDVDDREIKVKTPDDDFHMKVPREVAAQLREGDTIRLDVTFRPVR
jgi:hypothetical protein